MSDKPIICELGVFDEHELQRYDALTQQMRAATQGLRELDNGYGLQLAHTNDMILLAAEFITYERRCCPFIDFALEVAADGTGVWLNLSGTPEVKQFLQAELGIPENL